MEFITIMHHFTDDQPRFFGYFQREKILYLWPYFGTRVPFIS